MTDFDGRGAKPNFGTNGPLPGLRGDSDIIGGVALPPISIGLDVDLEQGRSRAPIQGATLPKPTPGPRGRGAGPAPAQPAAPAPETPTIAPAVAAPAPVQLTEAQLAAQREATVDSIIAKTKPKLSVKIDEEGKNGVLKLRDLGPEHGALTEWLGRLQDQPIAFNFVYNDKNHVLTVNSARRDPVTGGTRNSMIDQIELDLDVTKNRTAISSQNKAGANLARIAADELRRREQEKEDASTLVARGATATANTADKPGAVDSAITQADREVKRGVVSKGREIGRDVGGGILGGAVGAVIAGSWDKLRGGRESEFTSLITAPTTTVKLADGSDASFSRDDLGTPAWNVLSVTKTKDFSQAGISVTIDPKRQLPGEYQSYPDAVPRPFSPGAWVITAGEKEFTAPFNGPADKTNPRVMVEGAYYFADAADKAMATAKADAEAAKKKK